MINYTEIISTSYHVHHDYRIVITTCDSSSFEPVLGMLNDPPVISLPCPKGRLRLSFQFGKSRTKDTAFGRIAGALVRLSLKA